MQTRAISPTISQAAALPTHVLMPSIVCRKVWTFMRCGRSARGYFDNTKHHPVAQPNGALPASIVWSDLLGRPVRSEVPVEHHLSAHDRVQLPAGRPLGELDLRRDDFLEHRVFRRLLGRDRVVNFEL